MKDKECKHFVHTYKCNKENCEDCSFRSNDNVKMEFLKELQEKTVPDITLCDNKDSYIKLSDVKEIAMKYIAIYLHY